MPLELGARGIRFLKEVLWEQIWVVFFFCYRHLKRKKQNKKRTKATLTDPLTLIWKGDMKISNLKSSLVLRRTIAICCHKQTKFLKNPITLGSMGEEQNDTTVSGVPFYLRFPKDPIWLPGFWLNGQIFLKWGKVQLKIIKFNLVTVKITVQIWILEEPLPLNGTGWYPTYLKQTSKYTSSDYTEFFWLCSGNNLYRLSSINLSLDFLLSLVQLNYYTVLGSSLTSNIMQFVNNSYNPQNLSNWPFYTCKLGVPWP